MKKIYIVVRPDVDADVTLAGSFNNLEAAEKCANDPNAEYPGYVWHIDLESVQDNYEANSDDDDEKVSYTNSTAARFISSLTSM
jgi:hypothetical protein